MSTAPTRDTTGLIAEPEVLGQVGVLAYLPNLAPTRFAVVTSRRTGRWVFPKGKIDEGMSPLQAAAQEAEEEAGVIGQPVVDPIGIYHTIKIRPPSFWRVEVSLYAMPIAEVLDVWEEAGQRVRRFVTLEEARGLIAEADMLSLAESYLSLGK